jgi:hypothetical protein
MISQLFYRFLKAFSLGVLAGVGLGFLAYLAQGWIGLPPNFLLFDLFVGAFFGLIAGWLAALRSQLRTTSQDLFFFLSKQIPWLADMLAPTWLIQTRGFFMSFTDRFDGVTRWFMGRFILPRLGTVGPFRDAVAKTRSTWRRSTPPTAQELAVSALGVLMTPLDKLFLAAYVMLAVGAVLFWCLPSLIVSLP